MSDILKKLFQAADNHGQDSGEPDHTVGDLQDVLTEAWQVMTRAQKYKLLRGGAIESIVELGAQEEFEVEDLVQALDGEAASQLETGNKNPNTNCLVGMACPSCGSFGPFRIFISESGLADVHDDGVGEFIGSTETEWTGNDYCKCQSCGHESSVARFGG